MKNRDSVMKPDGLVRFELEVKSNPFVISRLACEARNGEELHKGEIPNEQFPDLTDIGIRAAAVVMLEVKRTMLHPDFSLSNEPIKVTEGGRDTPAVTFANTLYDLDCPKWARLLFDVWISKGKHRLLVCKNFRIENCPRKETRNNGLTTLFLRVPFEVFVTRDGQLIEDDKNLAAIKDDILKLYRSDTLKPCRGSAKSKVPPPVPAREKWDNLRRITCARFVDRPEVEFILTGLSSRSPITFVHGRKHSGITTLLSEVAWRVYNGAKSQLDFKGFVHIDGRVPDGSPPLDLSAVVNTISQVLKFEAVGRVPPEDRAARVTELLQRYSALLLIDDWDAVSDGNLPRWLAELPEKSKALLGGTTLGELDHRYVTVVEMNDGDRNTFNDLLQQCIEKTGQYHLLLREGDSDRIFQITGSSPGMIETAVLFLADGGLLNDLPEALFGGSRHMVAWSRLPADSQRALYALALLPHGAARDMLAEVSGTSPQKIHHTLREPIERGLVRKVRRSLDEHPTYILPHDVRSFIEHTLKSEAPAVQKKLLLKRLAYFDKLTGQVGFCWDDLDRLKHLDPLGVRQNLQLVLLDALKAGSYTKALRIARNSRYYWYVRGYWHDTIPPWVIWRQAAEKLDKTSEVFEALVYEINVLAKGDDTAAIDRIIPRVQSLLDHDAIKRQSRLRYEHAIALYEMDRGELEHAQGRWEEMLKRQPTQHDRSAATRWLAECLLRQGKHSQAREKLEEHYKHARRNRFRRSAVSAQLKLAQQSIDERDFTRALERLAEIQPDVAELEDISFLAQYAWLRSHCLENEGDLAGAIDAMDRAVMYFDRLGSVKAHLGATKRRTDLAADLADRG